MPLNKNVKKKISRPDICCLSIKVIQRIFQNSGSIEQISQFKFKLSKADSGARIKINKTERTTSLGHKTPLKVFGK